MPEKDYTQAGQDLLLKLVTFGALDLAETARILIESGEGFDEFPCYVDHYLEDTGTTFLSLDLCALAYEFLLLKVGDRVCQHTRENILETGIFTYGNYYCSSYEDCEAAHDLVAAIPERDRDPLLDWFLDHIA